MYGCESWTKESWVPKNWCFWTVMLEKTLESALDSKEIQPVSILKEISPEYSLEGLMLRVRIHTLATWWEELTHWKKLCCWESLKVGEEGEDMGWDGWMTSSARWTWVWASSGSWWWTGRLGMLQSMGLRRVGHNWVTELNWTDSSKMLRIQEQDYIILVEFFHA